MARKYCYSRLLFRLFLLSLLFDIHGEPQEFSAVVDRKFGFAPGPNWGLIDRKCYQIEFCPECSRSGCYWTVFANKSKFILISVCVVMIGPNFFMGDNFEFYDVGMIGPNYFLSWEIIFNFVIAAENCQRTVKGLKNVVAYVPPGGSCGRPECFDPIHWDTYGE